MPTATLTFGAYADPSFVGMKAIITRSAPQVDGSGNVSQVTWTVTIAADGTASVSGLPYNDDGTTYRCVWQALSYKPTPGNKSFQVLAAQGATVDYDTIANADGTTTPTVSPQVPLVTSVNGQTGAVVISGGGAVASVNGHAGTVVLGASDVGADAAGAAAAAQTAAATYTDGKVAAEVTRAGAAYDATGAASAAQAFAVQRANHTGTQSADTLTDGTTNKAFLATERTKLTGVATGATANSTDAQLRDRSTHTGTQPATTVTGLDAAVAGAVTPGGSATAAAVAADPAVRAAMVPKWKPSTAYATGEYVLNPFGQVVSANTAFTSGTTYNAANWTIPSDVDYWSGRQHVGLATGSMFFGAMTTAQIAADIALIRGAGGDTVRTDLDWSAIETSKGVYDWTKPDTVFDTAAAQGVALMFTVVGSPAWARTAGEPSKLYAPTNVADYANFCAAASARYKNRGGKGGHLWEIWNEPNCSSAFGTPLDYTKYVALIGAAYAALKATDPSCTVVVGGILRGGVENWGAGTDLDATWLNGAYAAGLAGKFDALGFHPYSEPWDPAATTPTGEPTGSNLVTNGTFDTNLTGWTAAACTLAQVTTGQRSGAGALAMTADGSGLAVAASGNCPVVAGTYYLASAYVKSTDGQAMMASINWLNASFGYLSTDDGYSAATTGSYTQVTVRATAPANAAYAVVKVVTATTPPAGHVYTADDVTLFAASSAEHGWNRIPIMRAIMAANGDAGKPIWLTEVGQHTGSATGFVDEPTQALYLTNALQRLKSYPYVQRMMWYSHRDAGTDLTNNQNNYGITHNDGSPKAAYYVMQSGPAGSGPVFTSPNGTRYRLTVGNDGALTTVTP